MWNLQSVRSKLPQLLFQVGVCGCCASASLHLQRHAGSSAGALDAEQPLLAAARGRFFKEVHVEACTDKAGHFQVLLDRRPVRTPGKQLLSVPSQALALALAAEWAAQDSSRPKLHTMPLMSLAATALDQPKPRDKVIGTLLRYVHTDATCCRVEKAAVALRQAQVHDPLLAWCRKELGWRLEPSDAIFMPPPDAGTVKTVQRMLEGLDAYHLAAMEQLTASCKSVVIAAALLHGHIRPQEALQAARVEEDCQVEEWGQVEAGHDLDIADLTTRVHAPAVFLNLLRLP